jgi:hypothetical protein
MIKVFFHKRIKLGLDVSNSIINIFFLLFSRLTACIVLDFDSELLIHSSIGKRKEGERVISSWMPTFDEASHLTTLSTGRAKKPFIRVEHT